LNDRSSASVRSATRCRISTPNHPASTAAATNAGRIHHVYAARALRVPLSLATQDGRLRERSGFVIGGAIFGVAFRAATPSQFSGSNHLTAAAGGGKDFDERKA